MDIETVRRATIRRKTVTAQRAADDRLNSDREIRAAARDLRIRASAILDPSGRHTMLRLAVDYEKRASQLDNKADAQ
jgi:hypothetical protein